MSGWLLDTNIISQFAPLKDGQPREAAIELKGWIASNADRIFLSVVSVLEITSGIAKLRRAGADRRAADLDLWFGRILEAYGERVLPVDIEIGKMTGLLADQARAAGRHPGLSDILIAATAKVHGHGLLTDNVRHFEHLNLDITLWNPLARSGPEETGS